MKTEYTEQNIHNNKNKSEKQLTVLGLNNFGSFLELLVPPHPPAVGSSETLPKRLVVRNLKAQYARAILPSKWSRCISPEIFSIVEVVTQ
jgi:hypothetical protein